MMNQSYGIIRLLRWFIVVVILATLATLFVYSPYYSKAVLWLLNQIVPVTVDPIAAKSQQLGQIDLEKELEPGSEEWVARRAYLYEVNSALKNGNVEQFVDLQMRYQQLLLSIEADKQKPHKVIEEKDTQLLDSNALPLRAADEKTPTIDFYQALIHDENTPLFQKYQTYLRQDKNALNIDLHQTKHEIAPLIFRRDSNQPYAIVILGGGLTSGDVKGEIIVNAYTKKRLEKAVSVYENNKLPIMLSGVEAPYMQKWLKQHNVKAEFLEDRSMNTCENTRFSSLMLQKQGGAPTVYLITDAYHMPRSQRLFAQNGIETIPIISELPNALTNWQPNSQNLMHSRRATYEVLASLRDIWFGESNCREIP